MSSLLYLGISVVVFFVVFGFLALLAPLIFGGFFGVMDNYQVPSEIWRGIYSENKKLVELLVPIIFAMGTFIAVLKILMSSTNKGRD